MKLKIPKQQQSTKQMTGHINEEGSRIDKTNITASNYRPAT